MGIGQRRLAAAGIGQRQLHTGQVGDGGGKGADLRQQLPQTAAAGVFALLGGKPGAPGAVLGVRRLLPQGEVFGDLLLQRGALGFGEALALPDGLLPDADGKDCGDSAQSGHAHEQPEGESAPLSAAGKASVTHRGISRPEKMGRNREGAFSGTMAAARCRSSGSAAG